MIQPTQTALIVPVPEAEPAVGSFRAALDPAAGWGVPAHVTVLYPFLPPARINEEVLATLHRICAEVPRFEVTFTHLGWFGHSVVWLGPRPEGGFVNLTAAVTREFPEVLPYGGAYPRVVPHLTIGQDAPTPVLRRAGEAVARQLPIGTTVEVVELLAGAPAPNAWHRLAEFALGAEQAAGDLRH